MDLLIKNGRILNPPTATDEVADILIENGKISKIAPSIEPSLEGAKDVVKVLDAKGCWVMPGFVDLHVHLRDPGFTYKEDVESGARAAVHGGFTTILAMPNTKPAADTAEVITYVHKKGAEAGYAHVLQIGAMTKGQEGVELADIGSMVEAGSPGISEDGKSVMSASLCLEAMKLAAEYKVPVFAHCEDPSLSNKGVMNAGRRAQELGMPGISNNSENVIAVRDVFLAQEAGVHLHLCHCSTKESVDIVRFAKELGISVTAEVCPHHIALTEEDISEDDANFKMAPPLRTKEDVEALKLGLKSGIIDVIATDHAPHSAQEKAQSMKTAPFGIIGLETAASLVYTELVEKGYLTPMDMAEKMSYNPTKILGLSHKGSLEEGKVADIVIFNWSEEFTFKESDIVSKSKNSPFIGRPMKGRVQMTIVDGRVVYDRQID